MQQLILPVLLASFWTICTGLDWCYQSQFTCDHQCNAPDKWNHAQRDCGGNHQSPINIVTRKTLKDERLTPFEFNNYQQIFRDTIKNNGHSVKVGVPHLSTISGGGLPSTYKAVQFHMHWGNNGGPGSEHTIDGEQYPMELHIVHMKNEYTDLTTALSDPEGVAVLGFFYETSNSANRKYDPITNTLRSIKTTNSNTSLPSISLAQLIPAEQNLTSFYRYNGSLTTPGCNEAVIWTVFENTIPLSVDQLRVFSELQFHDGKPMVGNFRPVQPLNGRQVFRSGGAVILVSSTLLLAAIATALGLSQPN
ncbi:carbonic anhydrase 4a isoform X5 [Perca fluviatilis]|uniref:carbonic anhydrase 4a isoform X4 n=1 Tax=Perca fluviatilis TaxID=8168 RepID=UPI0019639F6E|nr:carbonic anhydrase 4a isoform X4 [Perca fluviatilis]XP_039634436.1 carbonic anhydrase 4a isoform X5 [Perca fluviatilis]